MTAYICCTERQPNPGALLGSRRATICPPAQREQPGNIPDDRRGASAGRSREKRNALAGRVRDRCAWRLPPHLQPRSSTVIAALLGARPDRRHGRHEIEDPSDRISKGWYRRGQCLDGGLERIGGYGRPPFDEQGGGVVGPRRLGRGHAGCGGSDDAVGLDRPGDLGG